MIGLDLSDKYIKIVELKDTSSGPLLTRFAIAELPESLNKDNSDQTYIKTIAALLKELKFESKEVFSSIAGPHVQIRRIKLPAMPENELAQAVRWEAKNFITFPIEDAVIDSFLLDEENKNSGKLDIILIAVDGKTLKHQLSLIEKAGLKNVGVTLTPFALTEVIKNSFSFEQNEAYALIYIGEITTSINIYINHILQFNREITFAANDIANLDKLSSEISGSFEYFREHFGESKISQVIISGSSTLSQNISDFLSQSLSLPVTALEPNNIRLDSSANQDKFASLATRLTLAIGLALSKNRAQNLLKIRKEQNTKIPNYIKFIDRIYIPNSFIIGLLILLIGFFIGFNMHLNKISSALKTNLDTKNQKLTCIMQLQNRKSAIQEIIKKQVNVKELLARINSLMPKGLSLACFYFDNDKREVKLSGESAKPEIASSFVKDIEDSPYFSGARLNEIKKEQGIITFKMDFKVN